jgi:hypothetical protein
MVIQAGGFEDNIPYLYDIGSRSGTHCASCLAHQYKMQRGCYKI